MPVLSPDARDEGDAARRAAPRGMELRALNVDLDALEISARDASDETTSYLDTRSGEVVVIVKGEPDERMLRERVRGERRRFKKVPAFGLAEERALLREYLTRERGDDELLRLVDEPGSFHVCMATLKSDAALWRGWERFEVKGLRMSLLAWLASLGLRPTMTLSALTDD